LFIKNSVDNYDLLHTFGDSWAVGFLTWYFAKKKKPVVRELCNESPSPFFPKRFSMFIKPLFLNNNKSKIVAISPKLELMAQRHGVKSIWQRPNPVNFLRYSLNNRVNKLKLRNKLTKFSDNDIVLLNVGMFWKNKNQRFLIKLLSNLEYKYKLILIGVVKKEQENYYQQVITDIKKMSLEDRVEIVSNFINNPYDYMSLSDVYLFPSRHEGLGTPILEAQACGIPVVANDLPGVTDAWVKEGVGGYSCKLDLKLWSKAIMNASNIPENTLNKNSNYILRKSSSSVIDKKYFEIFNKLTR
jgi:glycosyltransferase involved in cell wall biosynthesis